MNPSFRGIQGVALFVAALALTACHTPQTTGRGTAWCGLSDPETMGNLGLIDVVAEYYVAHHQWPSSKAQLNTQLQAMLKESKADITPKEAKGVSEFLDLFTLLEFHSRGNNLVVHYRLKVERRTIEHTVVLKPGRTADEIIERCALEQL